MAKDVLEVLDAAIRDHRVSPQNAGAMQKARARIAELIAADVEYDAAKNAEFLLRYEAPLLEFRSVRKRVDDAEIRRAAALAACRELA